MTGPVVRYNQKERGGCKMYRDWYEANEMEWLAEQEAEEWYRNHPEEWEQEEE